MTQRKIFRPWDTKETNDQSTSIVKDSTNRSNLPLLSSRSSSRTTSTSASANTNATNVNLTSVAAAAAASGLLMSSNSLASSPIYSLNLWTSLFLDHRPHPPSSPSSPSPYLPLSPLAMLTQCPPFTSGHLTNSSTTSSPNVLSPFTNSSHLHQFHSNSAFGSSSLTSNGNSCNNTSAGETCNSSPTTSTSNGSSVVVTNCKPRRQRPKRFHCPHCHIAFSNQGQLRGHVR